MAAYDEGEVGSIDVLIPTGTEDIVALVNIEIKRGIKKQGYGKRIVEMLVNYSRRHNRPLMVLDIQKKALGFWKKMGVKFVTPPPHKHGIENVTEMTPEELKTAKYIDGLIN